MGCIPPRMSAGENISYTPVHTARWHVIHLLIDDGVTDRGHREALLDPRFERTGVACGYHARYQNMCVMTYAHDYQEAVVADR